MSRDVEAALPYVALHNVAEDTDARGSDHERAMQGAAGVSPEAAAGEASECRICRDGATNEALIQPCLCTGSMSGVHKSCLQKWIDARPGQDMRCEVCGAEYSVHMADRIVCDSAHACSCAACGHLAEGCILIFCLVCMSLMMVIIRPELEAVSVGEVALVGTLFAVTVIMSGFTLLKVFKRWRAAASARVLV